MKIIFNKCIKKEDFIICVIPNIAFGKNDGTWFLDFVWLCFSIYICF